MMFRLLLFTLYIIQILPSTHGQTVQIMPPQDSCVSTTITFRCPNSYIPIIRSASYGVAASPGSCSYTIGDCIADAMNIMTCPTDAVTCDVYLTRRKLAQCNDQFADYVRAEYDCVPISVTDPLKRYDICQGSTDIDSDHGIIESPNYPSQFQTTTSECFRAIHVPDDKSIRLWLTDLFIGSTSTNCADDHVYVVDSIQTYRHCGFKRLAYPDLCSTTIIIQYLVTTDIKTYRGMRMFFEIVDRSPNDVCPNATGTVTPVPATTPQVTTIVPDTTTPEPIYVTLGIASSIRSFQLCPGESYRVNCPDNYVFTIINNMFGVTPSGLCEPRNPDNDCTITSEPTFMCHQTCLYTFTGYQSILSCSNETASYQYVEYQCIPTNTELISNISCPTSDSITAISIDQKGRFQSCNYPNLQATNYTYRLTTKPEHSINFYSLDISLNGFSSNCQSNKLTLVDHDDMKSNDFCEQRSYSLFYSSCSNVVDLIYTVSNANQEFSKGAELYIQSEQRPQFWVCEKPLSTTSNPTSDSTTPFTLPTVTPMQNASDMFAGNETEHDICFNSILFGTCPYGYTYMIVGAFYGVKQQTSDKCGFVQGNCVQEALATITQCYTDQPTCYLFYSTKRRLAQCSDNYADYLHITSQCVPSEPVGTNPVQVYNVCDTPADIRNIHGVVTSPNFPSFQQTNDECQIKLLGVQDRILKIWINELAISSNGQRHLTDDSDTNEPDLIIYKNDDTNNVNGMEQLFPSIRDTCIKDYLMIDTPHVVYVYCGTRKLVLGPICTSSVVVHYKTTSPPNLFYKGFKFYFEWVEKPMGITCDDGPQPGNTTTPSDGLLPLWAQNLELSPVLSEQICFGTSKTLRCPRGSDYVLSIISSYYAVTGSGSCDFPTSSHCRQEASLGLTCAHSCLIEYIVPRPLIICNSQDADYLNIEYECIPTRLLNNENPIDICASTPSDTITLDSGIMISPQYPTLIDSRSCSKKIQTLDYKLWMVFIVDLFVEGENIAGVCNESSLTVYDGIDKIVRCGLHQPELVTVSCSNIIEFNFISNLHAVGYRGFKVYFKTIDVPPGWGCQPIGFTTTTMITTPQPPITTTLVPPSLQIWTYGGTTNGTDQYCKFPFTYQSNLQMTCLSSNPPSSGSGEVLQEPWCSTTSNFDTDGQWGYCNLGVTGETFYDICHSQSQEIKCPTGYVIDVLTADFAAKPDGSYDANACAYHPDDCFQSDAAFIQTRCAGYPSCTIFHTGRPLASCQNRQSAYFHIQYTCVPHDTILITRYDMCNSGSVIQNNTQRGFIISPNFPSATGNIDCTFNIKIQQRHQDIYLYIVDLELGGPNTTGSACIDERLLVTADNVVNEICGRLYTNLLAYTCHETISLQLIRKAGAIGRGVKLYFEFRDKPQWQLCPSLPTTTTLQTLSPTIPTTTTTGGLPSYFPNPSPRDIESLCYSDLSGIMRVKNFQCPSNYVLVIHRAFYGYNADNRCQHKSGDCTHEADIVYRTCAGQQFCSVSFISIILLPECDDVQANYLSVEYQCLPTPSISSNATDLCAAQIDTAAVSGTLLSPSYPIYTQKQCLDTTLTSLTASNLVIAMYLLDLDIGPADSSTGNCSDDYLSLSYQCNNQTYQRSLCGTQKTELLFSTCQPTDQIFASYNLISHSSQGQRGFALLYHLVPKLDAITTIPTQSTTTTTHAVTSPETPPGPGPLSTLIESTTVCAVASLTIKCNEPDYVLVIRRAQLFVSATNSCTYSPTDCYEDHKNDYNHCGGKTTCDLFAPNLPINACNNLNSHYLYVEHQCIPIRPKHYVDICSFAQSYERVTGGAIVSSLNYTAESRQCKAQLRSDKLFGSQVHKAFKIYILSLSLPVRPALRGEGVECSNEDPFIEIDDHEISRTRLCGLSHTRYVRETCSTIIDVYFNNTRISTEMSEYKGFEIYFESIQNNECRPTPAPIIPTEPFVIEQKIACELADNYVRIDFNCTPDYGLVFLQSNYFVTNEPAQCDVTNYTCYYSSEQPQADCSGESGCSFTHINPDETEVSLCQGQQPDAIEFYYQCLPMKPSLSYPKYSFCDMEYTSGESGFIETPFYPNTYQHAPLHCSLSIRVPEENVGKNHSIYLYIFELSLRDTSIFNLSTAIKCFDSINYEEGNNTHSICGQYDQPLLKYHTNEQELNLTLNITTSSPATEWSTWQGARLFFFIGNQSLPMPPGMITTTPDVGQPSTKPTPKSDSDAATTALIIIGVLAIVAAIGGFGYYRYRQRPHVDIPPVKYGVEMDAVDGATTIEAPEKRTSISKASLRGASSFVTPFYPKSGVNGKDSTDDETNV